MSTLGPPDRLRTIRTATAMRIPLRAEESRRGRRAFEMSRTTTPDPMSAAMANTLVSEPVPPRSRSMKKPRDAELKNCANRMNFMRWSGCERQ
jgi:hypothetical protein